MADDEKPWEKIATDPTLAGFPPGATIDPRKAATLAAESDTGPAGTVKMEPAAVAETKPKLPRISVAARTAAKRASQTLPSGSGSGTADLEIVGLLGEGGMGRVHLARQKSLARDVALKTVKGDSPSVAAGALVSEAVITGSLEHPGIIPVHALGVDQDAKPLLVMKRVEGVEWSALIHDDAHEEWSRWSDGVDDHLVAHIEILAQVCNAAHFAHSRGVAHRDIKPENVMLGRFGEVYLVDWGVATRFDEDQPPQSLAGSPAYMAPEMVAGEAIDAQTDVYLLGATLHEVLTKHMPHEGDTMRDVLAHAALSDPYEYADSVPQELADLCHRAMAQERVNRPKSALEVRQSLLEFLRHRSSIELADSANDRLDALQLQLEKRPGETPEDLPLAYRRLTEARFGFTQALKEWGDNVRAKDGLQRCIERMIDVELLQENGRGARALLEELPEARADLERRVADLEQKLEVKARREDKLRALEKDLDQSVGARQRVGAVLILGVFGLAVTAWALLRGPDAEPITPRDQLVIAGTLYAGAIIVVAIWGRPMFQNQYNRRVLGAGMSALTMIIVNRTFGYVHDSEMATVFMHDLLVITAVAVTTAVTLIPWIWMTVPLYAGGAVLILLLPEHAVGIFTGSTMLAVVVMAYFWSRRRPAE